MQVFQQELHCSAYRLLGKEEDGSSFTLMGISHFRAFLGGFSRRYSCLRSLHGAAGGASSSLKSVHRNRDGSPHSFVTRRGVIRQLFFPGLYFIQLEQCAQIRDSAPGAADCSASSCSCELGFPRGLLRSGLGLSVMVRSSGGTSVRGVRLCLML